MAIIFSKSGSILTLILYAPFNQFNWCFWRSKYKFLVLLFNQLFKLLSKGCFVFLQALKLYCNWNNSENLTQLMSLFWYWQWFIDWLSAEKKGKKKKCPLQEKRGLPSQFLLQWGEIISEVLIAFLHLTRCLSEEITSNYYYFQRQGKR